MWNAGLDAAQAEIKIARRNINNLRYADTILMAESKEELKSLLMKVKEESEKAALKLTVKKWRSWHPVPSSRQAEGEKNGTVRDCIFLGSKITADSDWSHEIKRCLLLGRKVMMNLVKVAQSWLTFWDPMDYTIHGIIQARILEWVVFPFSRGPSQPRDLTHIAGRFFTSWAIREIQAYWNR